MNRNDELYHFGIKGMKWGVRRYQNEDGSLTNEGKKRYRTVSNNKIDSEYKEALNYYSKNGSNSTEIKKLVGECQQLTSKYNFDPDDGGGAITKADEKAAEKYMQKQERLALLVEDAQEKGRAAATKYINSRYGEVRVNQKTLMQNTMAISSLIAMGAAAWTTSQTYGAWAGVGASLLSGYVLGKASAAVNDIPIRYQEPDQKARIKKEW